MLNLALGTPISDEGRSCIVTETGKSGHAVYGPYELLEPGSYIVEFHVELANDTSFDRDMKCAILDISRNSGNDILSKKTVHVSQLRNGRTRFRMGFELSEPSRMEYRAWVSGKAALIIDEHRRVIRLANDAQGEEDVIAPEFPGAEHDGTAFFRDNKAYFRSLYEQNYGVRVDGDAVILTTPTGISFFTRSQDDLTFIGEIFSENAYNFLTSKDMCVIDIGMNIGLATLSFANKPEVREVHSFEPFPITYDRAVNNLSLNPALARKVRATNAGVSDRNWSGDIMMATGTDSGAQSTVAAVQGDPTFVELRDAGETLRPIIENARASGLNVVVKVDCEGSEFAIFESLDRAGLFSKIDGFMVEWHAMFADKSQHTLFQPLRRNGFIIFDRSPTIGNGFFYAARIAG